MALIKQSSWTPGGRDAVALHLGDLRAQAAVVEQEAARKAVAIIAHARDERERQILGGREQGLREGYAKGLAEGRAKGEAEGRAKAVADTKPRLAEIEARWMTGAAEFEAARDHMLTEARRDLLRLAVRIAERVIKRRIETDPNIAASQLEAVLSHIMRPSKLTIAVCPDDEQTLREAMPAMMKKFSAAEHMDLVLDPSLPRGSCVARTIGGEIDASIWTQLDRVADTLLFGGLTHDAGPRTSDPSAPAASPEPEADA